MSRVIIAAVSPSGVIGVGGRLPWHYPADLKRFKRLTLGGAVIMGRHTWESLPVKPLPGRRNIVVTRRRLDVPPGVEVYADLGSAVAAAGSDVWFIGGRRIFEEAMRYADAIDLTYVPDEVAAEDAVYFPPIDPTEWEAGPLEPHEDDPRLRHRVYRRIRRA